MRRRDFLGSLGCMAGAAVPVSVGISGARADSSDCQESLRRRYDEVQLISRRLEGRFHEGLLLWNSQLGAWGPKPPGHVVVHGRVVVVHLWADYCAPCRAEFPWLKEVAREASRRYKGQVQFLFVSETNSSEAMQQFIEQNRATMPDGPHYLDTGNQLSHSLGEGLSSGTLSLPTTLLCDPLVVRQGLIGPLASRRAELRLAIERLLGVTSSSNLFTPMGTP